jgi:hypothetical protein
VPDGVAVSHSAFDVAVNGTVFPVPTEPTCNVCDGTDCEPPACPVNVSDVGEICNTGFAVT